MTSKSNGVKGEIKVLAVKEGKIKGSALIKTKLATIHSRREICRRCEIQESGKMLWKI